MNLEEIHLMVEDCLKRETKMSCWEQDFMADMEEREEYTTKQFLIIERIWERIT